MRQTDPVEMTDITMETTDVEVTCSKLNGLSEPKQDVEDLTDSELDSETEETDMDTNEGEDVEEEMLNMPELTHVVKELGTLHDARRLVVHSLNFDDVCNPKLIQLMKSDDCSDIKLQFVRPTDRPNDWAGFLTMSFHSMMAADNAVEIIKQANPTLKINSKSETRLHSKMLENWIKSERGTACWQYKSHCYVNPFNPNFANIFNKFVDQLTDRMLYVKNLSESTEEKDIVQVMCGADDVIIRPHHHSTAASSSNLISTREAYVIYRTPELAQAAAEKYSETPPELKGCHPKIFKYRLPPSKPIKGYLPLRERRIVMKYREKLLKSLNKRKPDDNKQTKDSLIKRLKCCEKLIEQDNTSRELYDLSAPSLEDLRGMPGVKGIRGQARRDLLIKLGVIEAPLPLNCTTTITRISKTTERHSNGIMKLTNGNTINGLRHNGATSPTNSSVTSLVHNNNGPITPSNRNLLNELRQSIETMTSAIRGVRSKSSYSSVQCTDDVVSVGSDTSCRCRSNASNVSNGSGEWYSRKRGMDDQELSFGNKRQCLLGCSPNSTGFNFTQYGSYSNNISTRNQSLFHSNFSSGSMPSSPCSPQFSPQGLLFGRTTSLTQKPPLLDSYPPASSLGRKPLLHSPQQNLERNLTANHSITKLGNSYSSNNRYSMQAYSSNDVSNGKKPLLNSFQSKTF